MAKDETPKESTVFRMGDRTVDAWGRDAEEGDDTPDYSHWAPKELKAEIERRNEGRAEEDQIVLDDNKKSTAVAALEADDKASAEDDGE